MNGSTYLTQRRPRRARIAMASALTAVLVFLAVPATAQPGTAATKPSGRIQWHPCKDLGAGVDCAMLKVPLDYSKPKGTQIALSVARVKARIPSKKIGSLFFNVGGPGFGAVDRMREISSVLPQSIQDRFDIVGWDPRGTGRSSAVDCETNTEDLVNADSTPDTTEELATLTRLNKEFGAACLKKYGKEFLSSIGTDNTIRDLDRLRSGVGDSKVTFLGFSYGTYIGARYAEQYPDRVRAIVFDGPVDPTLSVSDSESTQRVGFQHAFNVFLRSCTRDSSCALQEGDGPRAQYEAARARSEDGTITATRLAQAPGSEDVTSSTLTLTAGMFDIGIAEALYYGEQGYTVLARAIQRAADGDGTMLLALADEYNQRQPDGTYSPELQAFQAISCVDHGAPTEAAWKKAFESAKRKAPDFGGSGLLTEHWCASWPVAGRERTDLRFPATFPRTLIIAATADPATPLTGGKGLAKALPNSFLLTVDSAEHTNATSGNSCVDKIWPQYLITTRLPSGRQKACGS